jgi:lactoylglutathione lyase
MIKLTHIRLLVSHVQACLSFYRDALEMQVLWADEDGHYVSFKTGDIVLALNKKQAMAEVVGRSDRSARTDCQDPIALILAVDDVDVAYQELMAKGVAFVTKPMDRVHWGIRTAHFRDPDGNLIEINESLKA